MEGSTVKKAVQKEVETSKKVWGYVVGERELENGAIAPGGAKKGPPKL